MKDNLEHFSERMEQLKNAQEVNDAYLEKNKKLNSELVSNLSADVKSPEVQNIVHQLVQMSNTITQDMNMGENFWDMVIDGYMNEPKLIAANDKLHGEGASNFMGRAYFYYFHGEEVEDKNMFSQGTTLG